MPGKTPAALLLAHLYRGRVYAPSGRAIEILEESMLDKHGMGQEETIKALNWCIERKLVRIDRGPNGVTLIEITAKYRPPR